MLTRFLAVICIVLTACGGGEPDPNDAGDAVRRARAILERAIQQTGTVANLAAGSAFTIHGTGTLDKAAEGQAFAPDQPAPGPFRESLALDWNNRRVSRQYREDRFDGSLEHITEQYHSDSTLTTLVHTHGIAVPSSSADNVARRRALLRRLPHALLAEVARDGTTPRWLGSDETTDSVAALLESGTPVTLRFDRADGFIRSLSYDTILAGRGRVTLTWTWNDWRAAADLGRFPFRYAATVDRQTWIDVFVDSITLASDADFAIPRALRTIPMQYDSGAPPPPLQFHAVAPGVFAAPDVRAGFAPLVIERTNDVVVVDAPASFPLLGSIPLAQTDPGPPGWISERFVDAIRDRFADKPIAFLILTHGHEDHAAGVRAFVAAGATVVAHASIRPLVQKMLGVPARELSDRYGEEPRPLEFMAVQDSLRIDSPNRPIRILHIDPNPHASGLLAVHLPAANLLFVSDLVTPARIDVYPRASHAPLDLAFVRWFDDQNLGNVRILAMHGSGELTPDHLARLRQLAAERDSLSVR